MVPLFVYVAKVPVNEAIAMSLIIVGLSSTFAAVKYFRQKFVNKRLAVLFVVPGMIASFFGGRVARSVSAELLLFMFGVLMMLISLILYKKSSKKMQAPERAVCRPDFTLSITVGAAIGFLTGLLGVGGGFLIVPAIALLMRCSLYTAIGTSLAVIAVNSITGFIGHISDMKLNILLSAVFLAATLSGAIVGTRVSDKFNVIFIQKAFAVLIFVVGGFLSIQNIHF